VSWEEHYLPRLQFSRERVYNPRRNQGTPLLPLIPDGLQYLADPAREEPVGLHCGSLFGRIRNWLGLTGVSYLAADDTELFCEIIDTVGRLCYDCVREVLSTEAVFDFVHFWEDICYKTGPLVDPSLFRRLVGPYYRRITELTRAHGMTIASLDCDGRIDALIPTWIENGVNTMFPIEVGTWHASIEPWRRRYGKELRGVGGVNKNVFSQDYAAIDAEIERIKPLVELGGYLPCPDHRIAPDAAWENVQHYCERMRATFGG
jgi:uroporphyrinogen decarboxylase